MSTEIAKQKSITIYELSLTASNEYIEFYTSAGVSQDHIIQLGDETIHLLTEPGLLYLFLNQFKSRMVLTFIDVTRLKGQLCKHANFDLFSYWLGKYVLAIGLAAIYFKDCREKHRTKL